MKLMLPYQNDISTLTPGGLLVTEGDGAIAYRVLPSLGLITSIHQMIKTYDNMRGPKDGIHTCKVEPQRASMIRMFSEQKRMVLHITSNKRPRAKSWYARKVGPQRANILRILLKPQEAGKMVLHVVQTVGPKPQD
jgi:hypothetical protein